MVRHISDYPVVLLQDRYGGAYSGGSWLGIANADELVDGADTRAQFCLTSDEGPSGSDLEARLFWQDPPEWIVVAMTPELALKALSERAEAAPNLSRTSPK